ncbi:Pkinase-domain-containing protein [Pholiota conissans]|uniref:Pkinase-domain-containing protein n=1 Tax=Pholiota conissans TaxID=109636 RepID=A0A9P5YKU0_9AGAR|nr:Pkinase-domain-containing protein [Pholiota conissans]
MAAVQHLTISTPPVPTSYKTPSVPSTSRISAPHPSGHRSLLPVGPAYVNHLRLSLHHAHSFSALDRHLEAERERLAAIHGKSKATEDDLGVGSEEEPEELLNLDPKEWKVRNEIAVLKRVSSGHRNIVTLHDYFETAHNLYLVFDLCTGGELFDRICAKGNYYEADARGLVRTIFIAVKYIHDAGIVHRDLKPENLLFRTVSEEADIMIADFGLSRVMEEEKLNQLTEICGTPGYMAPEIFKKTGHGKPVDIWAMGVITYFLLAGYTPFDRDSQQQEMDAIIAGDYKFEPAEYWANVSETAKDFVRMCLTVDPLRRPTAALALEHKWLADEQPHFVTDTTGAPADLLPNVKKAFNAKQLLIFGMMGWGWVGIGVVLGDGRRWTLVGLGGGQRRRRRRMASAMLMGGDDNDNDD